jgi:hypothetical protein
MQLTIPMHQLIIRAPGKKAPVISRFLPMLRALSLSTEELESSPWLPTERWSEFFEYRLRPMVYCVHAAVTQDFTLVGPKGVYSLLELEQIKYWVGRILQHCVRPFSLPSLLFGANK